MSQATLLQVTLRNGLWEAQVAGAIDPVFELSHLGQPLPGLTVTDQPEAQHLLRLTLPTALFSDGVQTLTLRDTRTGQTISHYTLIAGEALDHDLRAEVDLLRAELDLLKRAFRRHCVETGADGK